MIFSSAIFLFGFLPVVLAAYYVSPRSTRNFVLLVASIAFYAWGEIFYVGVMLTSILANYCFGRLIDGDSGKAGFGRRAYLASGVAVNLGLLVSFKYANFVADNLNTVFASFQISPVDIAPVHLPLGISFFTFQAISYIVDVYRREVPVQKSLPNLALYIALFPQLIAGPIVRYHDVSNQINDREHTLPLFASGVQRFVMGLAKKMLLANPVGEVADTVFALSGSDLTMPLAWVGIIAYTLQIYFDFSGYSDMAIGLGRMFGFRFLENFNYPYIAKSMREFWRRWHISLSTWFRDYVYIPLGGSRGSASYVARNLLIVFILTGVWHGASWNFVVWGLFHGAFLAAEHFGMSRIITRLWRPLQHAYVLLAVVVGWVFFRAETLTEALTYLAVMFGMGEAEQSAFEISQVAAPMVLVAALVACLLSMPLYAVLADKCLQLSVRKHTSASVVIFVGQVIGISLLLYATVLMIAQATYNPFIYFRF